MMMRRERSLVADMNSVFNFHECMVDVGLLDISYVGDHSTWCHLRSESLRI